MQVGKRTMALTAAGALLVAACGGDDPNPFCEDMTEVLEQWDGFDTATAVEAEAEEMLSDFRDLEPPEEIAGVWDDYVAAVEVQIAAASGQADPDAGAEQAEGDGAGLDPEAAEEAVKTVEDYLIDECD